MTKTTPDTTQAKDPRLLKILLLPGALFCLLAGGAQFLFPGIDAVLADKEAGELQWIYRLLGSVYIGLGIGMLRAHRNPAGQEIFISTLIIIAGLACVAFTITLFTASYPPIPWVLAGWLIVFVLLVIARQKARDIL
ncbi:hypothetical protein OAH36_05110 [Verrucomicrobia bacterium]|jgi:Na+/H+ antiporter NhaA|nr:hypothetical protein [Verrucomicrobiota bacterium]